MHLIVHINQIRNTENIFSSEEPLHINKVCREIETAIR